MKIRYWLIIVIVAFAIGFIIRPFINPISDNIVSTNWIVGNKTNYYTNYTFVTNNPSVMTEIFNDYLHFMADSFKVIQLNEDLNVFLWKRNFSYKIIDWKKTSGPLIGGGWDIVRTSPVLLFGWEFNDLGVLSTITISTNLGILLLGYWKVNLY